jgi:hypothetical protein
VAMSEELTLGRRKLAAMRGELRLVRRRLAGQRRWPNAQA